MQNATASLHHYKLPMHDKRRPRWGRDGVIILTPSRLQCLHATHTTLCSPPHAALNSTAAFNLPHVFTAVTAQHTELTSNTGHEPNQLLHPHRDWLQAAHGKGCTACCATQPQGQLIHSDPPPHTFVVLLTASGHMPDAALDLACKHSRLTKPGALHLLIRSAMAHSTRMQCVGRHGTICHATCAWRHSVLLVACTCCWCPQPAAPCTMPFRQQPAARYHMPGWHNGAWLLLPACLLGTAVQGPLAPRSLAGAPGAGTSAPVQARQPQRP